MCVDSVESAMSAEAGGAARVELCSSLVEGGTTPSLGMLRVVKGAVSIPVFAMVRPRGGDFCYSDTEFQVMKEDVQLMKSNGANGIVFGILTADGDIDVERSKELISATRPLPVTFHRAFDMVQNPMASLGVLIELGVERVLTSGHESSALEGLETLGELVKAACSRIVVVPGGGINERNLERILHGSGALEFHCSARITRESAMQYRHTGISMGARFGPQEFGLQVASKDRVRTLVAIGQKCVEGMIEDITR